MANGGTTYDEERSCCALLPRFARANSHINQGRHGAGGEWLAQGAKFTTIANAQVHISHLALCTAAGVRICGARAAKA
eukprot:5146265-Amphidinium_carterae.1